MKRFTQKFFLLAIGMLLSVGASAQDVTHAYPAVTVTLVSGVDASLIGKSYTIPAWDAYVNNPDASGRLRIQKKALISGKKYTAKLVTRYGIGDGNTLWVPALNETASIMVTVEGLEGEYDIRTLTYETVVPEDERDPNYGYTPKVLETNQTYAATGDYHAIIGDENGNYTIATTSKHKKSGQEFVIDEIGDWAFRQFNRSTGEPTYNWLRANTVTIPAGIKKIGRGSFYHIGHVKKYVFEEGSLAETTTIPEFNFTDNQQLEEIVFPSSVTALTGTVLGGCGALKKVTFNSATPPDLNNPFTWNSKTYNVFESTLKNPNNVDPTKCIIEFPLKYANDYMTSAAGTFLQGKKFALSSPITMTGSGLMSCCSPVAFTVKQYNTSTPGWEDADLMAYYVNSANVKETSVTLTEIDQNKKIPAEVGVILKGTAGAAYGLFFPYANSQPSSLSDLGTIDNSLVGVIEDDEITYNSAFLYYILNGGKFRPVTQTGTIKANKAYLKIGAETGTPIGGGTQNALSIEFSEGTGIVNAQIEKANGDAIYTLHGILVTQPNKGIFIKNGKKYIVK